MEDHILSHFIWTRSNRQKIDFPPENRVFFFFLPKQQEQCFDPTQEAGDFQVEKDLAGGGIMDQIMGKVGGLWFSQNAGKEMNNVGEDLNVRPPPLLLFRFLSSS